MPGYDRTGPLGQGPMTGGGFGLCGGNAAGMGRGRGGRFFGRGMGRGRGFFGAGFRFFQNSGAAGYGMTIEDLKMEKELLEQKISALEKNSNVEK